MNRVIEKVRSVFRSNSILDDLPYIASMMSAMSRAGMDLTDILRSLQDEVTFSAATQSLLASIISESQSESLSIVLNAQSKAFSGRIQSFLSGLAVETVKGDITPFLESFTAKLTAEKLREEREATTLEQVLSVVYATLFVIGPMVLIIVVSALSYLSTPLFPVTVWFQTLFFVYVPVGAFFFTVMGWKKAPLRHAVPFIVLSTAFLYVGLAFQPFSDIFISLAGLIFLPLGLYELMIWLQDRSIDQNLPTFLKDFAFQLFSGRDFLQSFNSLVNKQYGNLTTILQKTVNAMELGESFTSSVELLLNRTIMSKRVTTLLTSLMRKGGDVGTIMESISDFSWSISQIEAERRKRQYLTIVFFYIFFAVFLFLATSILQFRSSLAPVIGGSSPPITKTLFVAAVISAISTGLVAGVLSTKKIGVGGVHVFFFTLMSIAFYYNLWNIP